MGHLQSDLRATLPAQETCHAVRRPRNHEILYAERWTGRWEHIRDAGCEALAGLIRKLGLERVELGMGDFYTEVVGPDNLPTNDLLWAWKRDLETHGKIVVTVYTDPEDADEWEQICIWIVDRGHGNTLEVVWFGDEFLQRVRKLARTAQGE